MTPLSTTNRLFLLLEKRQKPTKITGLLLFEFPDDADGSAGSEYYDFELLRSFGVWFDRMPPNHTINATNAGAYRVWHRQAGDGSQLAARREE